MNLELNSDELFMLQISVQSRMEELHNTDDRVFVDNRRLDNYQLLDDKLKALRIANRK